MVHLGNAALSPAALKAVLVFMYTERLDVSIEEVEPVLRVLRKCRLKRMVACVRKERRTLRYYFKSTRKGEAGPRRLVMFLRTIICAVPSMSMSIYLHLSAYKALSFREDRLQQQCPS